MASFKIHEDGENSFPALSDKLKQLGPIQQKRVALGELNKNVLGKREQGLKAGLREGENAAEIKEKGKSLSQPAICKPAFGEIKSQEGLSCQHLKKTTELDCKGVSKSVNEKGTVSVKVTSVLGVDFEKPDRLPLQEIKLQSVNSQDDNKNDGCLEKTKKVLSPMVVDDSPAAISVSLPKSIKLQLEDLYACVTYKDDIFKYLKHRETLFRPKPEYMKRQHDVTYSMRTILVDWLVEVGEEYKLLHPTLFLTVSFVDRFLSSMAVVRGKLQLLGTAAMFLASKFEEIYPPEVSEFTYITDDSYTKKQVLRMENLIAKVLDFNLSTPTSYTFIMHIAASTRMPEKIMFLSIFICELTLLEADPYLAHLPSLIACGAIALARHCLGYIDVWPTYLIETTGYSLKQLAPVIQSLNATHAKSFTSSEVAIKDKYRSPKYQMVSTIPHKKLSIRMDC